MKITKKRYNFWCGLLFSAGIILSILTSTYLYVSEPLESIVGGIICMTLATFCFDFVFGKHDFYE